MSEVNGDKGCRKILGGFDIEPLVLFGALSLLFFALFCSGLLRSLNRSGCIFVGSTMIMLMGVMSIVRRGRDVENLS